MTKKELIKALEPFRDNDVIIFGDWKTGWSNVKELKADGCCISIMEDQAKPFTSDN